MVLGTLETFKTYSDIASNVATIAAIVIGAIWSYRAFFRERVRWPKATVELVMSHRELTPEWTLLNVKVKVHNTGKGLMKLTSLRVDVYQVLPLTEEKQKQLTDQTLKPEGSVVAKWHPLQQGMSRWGGQAGQKCEPELEPDENEEFGNDFLVPATLETAYVYVYIANEAKRSRKDLGWTVTSYYDLKGKSGGESAVNVIAGEPAVKRGCKGGGMREGQHEEPGGEQSRKKPERRAKKRFLRRKKKQRPPEPSPFGEETAEPEAEAELQREQEDDPFKQGA